MIDWFAGYVGYDASKMEVGRFFEANAQQQIIRIRPRWETAVGSYEAGVQVTRADAPLDMFDSHRKFGFLHSPYVLRMSGNPSKFLQGHNAAGPSVENLGPVLQALVRALGEGLRPADADSPILPSVHRSRVDVTTAVDLGSHDAVHEWIQLACANSRSRHGRAINSSGTVYWGKTSSRWTMKAYCKHCELQAHPPKDVSLLPDLLEWTRTHLRIELTLRRPELKERGTLTEAVIWEFFARLELHTMAVRDYVDAKAKLSVPCKLALQAWYDGVDVKSFIPSRTTLWRYRKQILEAAGVDVTLPRSSQLPTAMPVLLGMDELQAREVKNVPARIQRSLFGAGT